MQGPLNGHQAILFYGSSPGVGKSTLSSFLFEQLRLHQIPVFWVYEDDVLSLPYFAQFIVDIQSGNPTMMESLRSATRAFVEESIGNHVVALTDSIYPCINWLISTNLYSQQELRAFAGELEQLLAPLDPLIVFLDADPKIALQRAIEPRGDEWFEELGAALNSYAINRERPLRTLDEVAAYFRLQAALSLDVLRRWSCDLLIIDAMQMPLAQVKATLLGHLGLEEIQNQSPMATAELGLYVGVYQGEGNVPTTNPLVITLKEETLWVNTYWPNGCPLLAEGEGHFRLENTSHRILFERQPNGLIVGLTYNRGGTLYHFRKTQSAAALSRR